MTFESKEPIAWLFSPISYYSKQPIGGCYNLYGNSTYGCMVATTHYQIIMLKRTYNYGWLQQPVAGYFYLF